MANADRMLLYILILVPMLAYRVVPLFALKGRELPPRLRDALALIPPAAFAALVANDIIDPVAWAAEPLAGLVPMASALIVVPVAKRSGSLVWSALAGMCAYALLGYCVSLAG